MAVSFDVSKDDSAVQALLSRGPQIVDRTVELTAVDVWGNLQKEVPRKTGRLSGSWSLSGGGGVYRIVSGVDYARIVWTGRKGFGPKRAKALRFEVNGQVVFAKRVGPVAPNKYVERSFASTRARLSDFVARAISESGG